MTEVVSYTTFVCLFSSKLQVQLGDHVVIKGERTGRIRYIGHLDKIGQPNMVFVGLELDAPGGLMTLTFKRCHRCLAPPFIVILAIKLGITKRLDW
jgi:hypothetical protein